MYRTFNIGQYVEGSSLLHKAHPFIKVIFVVVLSFMVFSAINFYQFFLFMIFILSLSIFMGLGSKDFFRIIKFSKMFIYFSLFAGLFKYSDSYIFEFFIFKLSVEGLMISLQSALRVIFMIVLSVLITRTTSIVEFLKIFDIFKTSKRNLLFEKIGDMGLITILSVRFVPLIFEEAHRIRIAQSARGVNFETKSIKELLNNYSAYLGQLMISTIKRAEIITLAIVNKGYGMPLKKASYMKFSFSKSDFKLITIIVILVIINNLYLVRFT